MLHHMNQLRKSVHIHKTPWLPVFVHPSCAIFLCTMLSILTARAVVQRLVQKGVAVVAEAASALGTSGCKGCHAGALFHARSALARLLEGAHAAVAVLGPAQLLCDCILLSCLQAKHTLAVCHTGKTKPSVHA